jgi:hypothetical protein
MDSADVRELLQMLRDSQADCRRLMDEQHALRRSTRRYHLGLLVIALVVVVSAAIARNDASPAPVSGTSQTVNSPATERARLLGMLTAQEREQLEQFEAKVRWLGEYMQASTDFNAGAAVALFLSKMAEDMSAVPEMHQEMQTMNVSMAAVPAMVAEMRAINAKLAVITATMDSTMGRAGRMFPWTPFTP